MVSSSAPLLSGVRGVAGGPTPSTVMREEIIAFGGIPDPVSVGRQLSYRLQDHSEVDDI